MKSFYEKNIDALIKIDPMLGTAIFSIGENKKFEVFQGKDALDINLLDVQRNDFMYEKPLDELVQTVNEFHNEYVRYPVLFFYGMGNGLLCKALLENESLMHLIVVEPNLEIIYIALNFIDVSEELISGRIVIKTDTDISFATVIKLIEQPNIRAYAKLYNLHIHSNYYAKNYAQNIKEINDVFIKTYKHIVIGHGNDATDSLIGIEQHIANMPEMFRGYKTKNMFKKKNSEVAVIVSTGPSLTKQLPLLKEYAEYMTIISVDASLPILQKHGIVPDFVTSIERVIESSSFFDNVKDEKLKDTYFVVSSLADPYTVHKLKNQKLMLSMRPLSYMMYYALEDFGYLGSGMSAANLAYQLAAHMSYKDIILIGQDLAYSKSGVSHAKGHKYIKNKDNHKDSDVFVEAYGGDGVVKTSMIWNMFKNFFENDIYEAKECCGMITYNATEGGARIINSVEIPFKEILEKLIDKEKAPKKTKIKLNRVTKKTSDKVISKANEKTVAMREYGVKLKKEVEELFLKVTKKNELIEEQAREDVDYEELLTLIEEIDVIKAEVESDEFSKMFTDTVQSYIFHQELNIAKLMVENSQTDEQKKEKLIKWAKIHQYWLFSLAGGIEAQLYAIDSGRDLIENKANEFKFLDSLVNIDKEKLKDLYCKDAIGFLAIEKNLYDKDFINYIKELYIRFPQVTFKAFYFNDVQKELVSKFFKDEVDRFNLITPINIYQIVNEIEIYFEIGTASEVIKLLMFNSKKILTLTYSSSLISKTLKDYSGEAFSNHVLLRRPNLFSLNKEDLNKAKGNILKLQFNKVFENLEDSISLEDNKNVYDLYYYDSIQYILQNKEYKQNIININSNIWKSNYGVI
ncbi:MAG: 6-hydroxymethylpterin diphosphokinase MptE-like protein [Campylobacterota bacterium]|nr:6-hydroxymethylpterin diphosphokinase MptE-like protein [Campylobacterota bacterium]